MLSRLAVNSCNRTILKTNATPHKVTTNRSLHLICRIKNDALQRLSINNYERTSVVRVAFVRHASTDYTKYDGNLMDYIPDPPQPIQNVTEKLLTFHANGEATFESLGLGGWSPVGLIQTSLEWLHVSQNLPWWMTIAIGTLVFRLLMSPLVVKAQKNAAAMQNTMPKVQELQVLMTEARQAGNDYEAAKYGNELYTYMKENKISPVKNFIPLLIQTPVFISFFVGLRRMANLPVESLKEGGLWWFRDLTVADPYYILPIITSLTLLVTLEIGTDTAQVNSMGNTRYLLRVVPFLMLPFILHFPAAILCYWVSTNFISLGQTAVIRTPYFRQKLGIPALIKHSRDQLPLQKGFVKGMRDSWDNLKISRQIAQRAMADDVQFKNAAKGPIQKTYKYNPVVEQAAKEILSKKKTAF